VHYKKEILDKKARNKFKKLVEIKAKGVKIH
jgi:hypothetical protein